MKIHFTFFLLFLLLLSFSAFAQGDKEDVIYLKNGSTYRGTIIEQVPFVSYKIEIFGGSVIDIAAADVEKVTKEEKLYVANKPKPVFHYRDKGYFFLAQAHLGAELGFSIINGYKIGQFGMIGIGSGVDWLYAGIGNNAVNTTGAYVPLFLYYGGDILKRKISPFYNLYAGYGFIITQPNTAEDYSPAGYGESSTVQGGPMGGIGFGVRFYAYRHITSFTIATDLTIQHSLYWNSSYSANYGPGPNGYQYINTTFYYSSGPAFMFIPVVKFGIGF